MADEEDDDYVSEEDEDFVAGGGSDSEESSDSDDDGGGRKKRKKDKKEKKKGGAGKGGGLHAGLEGLEAVDESEIAALQAEAVEAYGADILKDDVEDVGPKKTVGRAAIVESIWRSMIAEEPAFMKPAVSATAPADAAAAKPPPQGLTGVGLGSTLAHVPASRSSIAGIKRSSVDAFLASVATQARRSGFIRGTADPLTGQPTAKRRRVVEVDVAAGVVRTSFPSVVAQTSGGGARTAAAAAAAVSDDDRRQRLLSLASGAKASVANKKVAIVQTVKFAGQTMQVTKLVDAGTEAAKRAVEQAAAAAARSAVADAERAAAAGGTSASATAGTSGAGAASGVSSSMLSVARRAAAAAAASASASSASGAFAASLESAGVPGTGVGGSGNDAMGLLGVPASAAARGGAALGGAGMGGGGGGGGHVSLGTLVANLDRPEAISTLTKSSLDWDTYKHAQGLEDDLAHAAKTGFVEKQAFLQRVGARADDAAKQQRAVARAAAASSSSSAPMFGGGR